MHFLLSIELIVTQWDVNEPVQLGADYVCTELIVTQWDVNELNTELDGFEVERINSYIVGCKFK